MALIDEYISEQETILLGVAEAVLAQSHAFETFSVSLSHIVLVGTGSSMNAALAGCEPFREAGYIVEFREPLSFLRQPPRKRAGTVVIALSQSGQSTTTVEAVRRALADGHKVLVLTADPASPIAATGADIVRIPCGGELVGAKTKGFTVTAATLLIIAASLCAVPLVPPPPLKEVLAAAESWAGGAAPAFAKARFVLFAGLGPMVGAALEASLKLNEIAGVPSFGCDLEEALHGRLLGIPSDGIAVLFAAGGEDAELARRAAEALSPHGPRVIVEQSSVSTPWSAVGAVIPFQLLAVAIARRGGRDPDQLVYPGLIAALAVKLDPSRM